MFRTRLMPVMCIVGGILTLSSACGTSDQATGPHGSVTQILVTPDSSALTVGAQAKFQATARNGSGGTVSGVTFFWSSSDTTIASVDQNGTVTTRHVGTAQIAASTSGVSGVATVKVSAPAVAAVVVAPSTATMRVNTTLQLTDTVKDATGHAVSDQSVTWTSDAQSVATVDAAGLVVARGVGTAHITATAGSAQGTATITVTLVPVASVTITPHSPSLTVGQTTQLTATVSDSAGNPLTGRTVTWSTSNGSVATVNAAGLVSGVAPGRAVITATSEGQSGVDTVKVSTAPVSAVVISPATSSLFIGQTEQLTAEVTDANGHVISGAPVTFTSADPGIATVNASTGVVTGVSPGITAITGTSGGRSGQAAVAVFQVPVSSVVITPASDSMTVGGQVVLQAVALDSAGHPLSGRAITWSSRATGIATVNSSGVVQGVAAGTAVILAKSGGKTGTSTVTVAEVPVGSVTIAPKTATLQPGQQQQFTATVHDRNGKVVTDRPVAWTSSNGTVVAVSSNGVAQALNPGTASIIASSGGAADTAAVTVNQVPVASVTVTPNPATVEVQSTVTLTATLKDASGNVLTGRPVTWSSNSGNATVNSSGVVTGVAAGSAVITASSGGQQGSATVTITAVPVAQVTVAPADTTITTAQTAQMRVTVTDSLGHQVANPSVTWTSAPAGRVSGTGLVTPQPGDTATGITVTAASGGKSSAAATVHVTSVPVASVTVTPANDTLTPGGQVTLTATAVDAAGHPLPGRNASWGSSNQGTATVSASGVVTAAAPGTATITATIGGKNGTANVVVNQAPVASVTVTPNPASVQVQSTVALTATLKDASGNVLSGRPVAWSSNSANATVNSSGVVTGVAAGSAVITASSGGQQGSATVNVTAVPVAQVAVAPADTSITTDETAQMRVTVTDALGHPVANPTVAWTSSPAGRVSATGLVTPQPDDTLQPITVTATSGGVSGNATVQVTSVPVGSVSVAPPDTTINASEDVQLRATVVDAHGHSKPHANVTWSSVPDGRVSSSGMVTPQPADAGQTIAVTATARGQSGSATVNVTPPPAPVSSVRSSAPPSSLQRVPRQSKTT